MRNTTSHKTQSPLLKLKQPISHYLPALRNLARPHGWNLSDKKDLEKAVTLYIKCVKPRIVLKQTKPSESAIKSNTRIMKLAAASMSINLRKSDGQNIAYRYIVRCISTN